jgi:hypothetical protein
MKKLIIEVFLLSSIFAATSAWPGIFSSCDSASKESKPDWVIMPDYSLHGFYVGVGSAEDDGSTESKLFMDSDSNAKRHLVEQIEVRIEAENELSTRVNNQKVQKDSLSKIKVSAEEVLRGLNVKSRWVDKANCTHYTLMVISRESIVQTKQEKVMKSRLEKFKTELAEGSDHEKNRDIKLRRIHLETAQALLEETNFKFLPEDLTKDAYAKQLSDALAQLNKESSQTQGHMALFAINKSSLLNNNVIAKMLDQLRSGDNPTDRLMADCSREEECISRAKERGFNMLTLLSANTQIVTSQMGTLKGTLIVSKTVLDIESRKVVKGPDTELAEVIGWSKSELDWDNAAEKVMQAFNERSK